MTTSSGKISSTLSLLQQAATQALLEDKEEGFGGLLVAADQIANERGLTSPLRRKSPHQLDRSLELSQSLDRYSMNERGVLNTSNLESSMRSNRSNPLATNQSQTSGGASSVHVKETEDDALALLKQMNVEPIQPSSEIAAFEADVEALLAMGSIGKTAASKKAGKAKPNTSSPRPFRSKSATGRQRYLERLQKTASLSRTSAQSMFLGGKSSYYSGSKRRGESVVSEPSRVAMMLAMSEEKSYGDRIRSSFKTEMEEMLFRSMHRVYPSSVSSSSEGKYQKYQKMREIADRLSKPAQHAPSKIDIKIDPTLKHSSYEDAKESTFRPQIHGQSKRIETKHHDDEEDDGIARKEDPKYSFISRQEAEDRNRREELAYEIGKKAYDAQLNKKECPKCHAKQSYDEVKEKRKICPNCRVEYCIPITWGKVSKQFFAKCHEYSKRVQHHKERIRQEIEDDYRYTVRKEIDKNTGKLVLIKEERTCTLTQEQEHEFLQRVQSHIDKHRETIHSLEKQILDEYYPFKPQIAKYLKHGGNFGQEELDDEDLDLEDYEDGENPIKAFLRRYEKDMDLRREKMPTRYVSIRKYDGKRQKKNENDSDGENEEAADNKNSFDNKLTRFKF